MFARSFGPIALRPVSAAERADDPPTPPAWPWLRLDVDAARLAGRWVRLTYRSGLLEKLVRPVLRCHGADAPTDRMLPAALFGRGIWLGRIPAGTRDLWISPTNRAGPFAFAIDRIDCPSGLELGAALMRRSPRSWFYWMFAPLIGLHRASDVQIRRHLSPTSLDRYDDWRRQRTRPLEWPGFDGAADAFDGTCHIRFVVRAAHGDAPEVTALLAWLRGQPYPRWSLVIVGSAAAGDDASVRVVEPHVSLRAVTADLDGRDLLVPVDPGDSLPDFALAAFAQAAAEIPDAPGFFADGDEIDGAGRGVRPRWGSDASALPALCGHAAECAPAFRVEAIWRLLPDWAAGEQDDLPRAFAARLAQEGGPSQHHIRRVLRTSRRSPPDAQTRPPLDRPARASSAAPRATLIIPTKDRLDLLGRCIDSLRSSGCLGSAEVIVVDNGSVQPETRTFLAALVTDARFRVIADTGPFNFSRLCNVAAVAARAPVLVFLNNDTEAIDDLWLDELLRWACRPDVGAAGAKLLYPDRSVQHGGVVVGIDGLAGHFERGCAPGDPGFFGRLLVPHEVTAVTAACLAVERVKFEAVGGFDEANLPVDLNDIDLCLRLATRGWRCVLTPDAVLIHHESASRGVAFRPDLRYRVEQATFRARWAEAIRDDPHFHPALSLDSLSAQLG